MSGASPQAKTLGAILVAIIVILAIVAIYYSRKSAACHASFDTSAWKYGSVQDQGYFGANGGGLSRAQMSVYSGDRRPRSELSRMMMRSTPSQQVWGHRAAVTPLRVLPPSYSKGCVMDEKGNWICGAAADPDPQPITPPATPLDPRRLNPITPDAKPTQRPRGGRAKVHWH